MSIEVKTRALVADCCLLTTSQGCGHGTLIPASSASVVPNAPTAAYSVAEGVRCSADVGPFKIE